MHKNILIIPIAVEDSDVQNCNLVDLFHRETIRSEVSNCIIMLYEFLEGPMFGFRFLMLHLNLWTAFHRSRLVKLALFERPVEKLHISSFRNSMKSGAIKHVSSYLPCS